MRMVVASQSVGVLVRVRRLGVSAELPVVGPPRVGGFDNPSESEVERLFLSGVLVPCRLDHVIVDPEAGEPVPDYRVVVVAVGVQCFDIGEEPGGGDRVEGGFQRFDVVAVRSVDDPSDRDAMCVDSERCDCFVVELYEHACGDSFVAGAIRLRRV